MALAARVAAAIVISVGFGFDHFPDAFEFSSLASDRATDAYHDWDFDARLDYDRYAGYVLPLSVLYRLFGDHLFLGQLLAAVFGAVAAALTYRLAYEVTERRWAILAGLIVALLPMEVVFSAIPYRDSAVWAVYLSAALAAALAARARGWRLAGLGFLIAGLLFVMAHLRLPTMIVSAWALVLAAAFSVPPTRLARVGGAVVVAVLVPWYTGLGPAGLAYSRDYSASEVRGEETEGAENTATTFVDADEEGGLSDLTHLPRGLSVMLLEPFPWAQWSGPEVRMAQAHQVLWCPLVLIAALGVPALVRRRRELAFLAISSGMILLIYALGEGNFGTAFRHRSDLVPALAILGAFGTPRLVEWWSRRRLGQRSREGPVPDTLTATPREHSS